jgi:hypothetical protein
MNKLDDFEKYLRDQLKGHAEPEPLMWNRLNDALGRVQPWYARSAFKYAFTAVSAMVFGAVSSYLYLDQQNNQTAQIAKSTQIVKTAQTQNTTQSTLDELVKGSNEQALQGTFANPSVYPIANMVYPIANTVDQIARDTSIHLEQAFLLNQLVNPTDKLALLTAGKIMLPKLALQNRPQVLPLAGRFELSLATGNTWSKLPDFDYHLGPQGMQHAGYRQQQSPLLALQARVYQNWHVQAGVQLLQTTLEEHFYHTDVFSYDDEEHYLFPYLYGFRQVSDEELHEGPWPYGPNIPVGPEISKVKADYSSVVNQQRVVLPLTLSYHQQFGQFEAQLHAGLAFSFATKTSQTLVVPGYLPSTIYLHSQNGLLQTFAQSQLRLSYKANRHLSIFVEPQLRSSVHQQNLVHATPFRSNSKALFAGLSWNF